MLLLLYTIVLLDALFIDAAPHVYTYKKRESPKIITKLDSKRILLPKKYQHNHQVPLNNRALNDAISVFNEYEQEDVKNSAINLRESPIYVPDDDELTTKTPKSFVPLLKHTPKLIHYSNNNNDELTTTTPKIFLPLVKHTPKLINSEKLFSSTDDDELTTTTAKMFVPLKSWTNKQQIKSNVYEEPLVKPSPKLINIDKSINKQEVNYVYDRVIKQQSPKIINFEKQISSTTQRQQQQDFGGNIYDDEEYDDNLEYNDYVDDKANYQQTTTEKHPIPTQDDNLNQTNIGSNDYYYDDDDDVDYEEQTANQIMTHRALEEQVAKPDARPTNRFLIMMDDDDINES